MILFSQSTRYNCHLYYFLQYYVFDSHFTNEKTETSDFLKTIELELKAKWTYSNSGLANKLAFKILTIQ